MSLVLDSSVTLAWLYSDELTPATQQVFERVTADGACVPSLWRLEVANSLQTGVRRSPYTMPPILNWRIVSLCHWLRSIRNCALPGVRSVSPCWEADA